MNNGGVQSGAADVSEKRKKISLVARKGFHYSQICTNGVNSDDDGGLQLKYQL